MNRCVKFFISINKLSKPSFNNGWRNTSEESRNTVKELFNCIIRDTDEWKELLKALFFGVEIRAPKAQLKRKSPETSHDGAASILEHPVARFCDRVALLACALVDPRFNEQWVNFNFIGSFNNDSYIGLEAIRGFERLQLGLCESIKLKRNSNLI